MDVSAQDRRRAFSHWMRTGIWPGDPDADGIEHKFNPYHDPRNGQFTFAPGGPRSLSRVIVSHGRGKGRQQSYGGALGAGEARSNLAAMETRSTTIGGAGMPLPADNLFGRGEGGTTLELVPSRVPRPSRQPGSKRHYEEERTSAGDTELLERAFPGLRNSQAGAIVAAADGLLGISAPANATTTALARNWATMWENDIRALVPGFRYGKTFPATFREQVDYLNDLRWIRAMHYFRIKGDLRPLQIETIRFMQESADRAYDRALAMLNAKRLKIRLSDREALGNYVDRAVRVRLRKKLEAYQIKEPMNGPVRVNRRENNTVIGESTSRRPDARVGNLALDVTLTEKSLKTSQVRGFFVTDFETDHVIIIRPSQIGKNYTYAIKRPGGVK